MKRSFVWIMLAVGACGVVGALAFGGDGRFAYAVGVVFSLAMMLAASNGRIRSLLLARPRTWRRLGWLIIVVTILGLVALANFCELTWLSAVAMVGLVTGLLLINAPRLAEAGEAGKSLREAPGTAVEFDAGAHLLRAAALVRKEWRSAVLASAPLMLVGILAAVFSTWLTSTSDLSAQLSAANAPLLLLTIGATSSSEP